MNRTSTVLYAVASAAFLALILIQFVSASNKPLAGVTDPVATTATAQTPDVVIQAADELAAWPAGATGP